MGIFVSLHNKLANCQIVGIVGRGGVGGKYCFDKSTNQVSINLLKQIFSIFLMRSGRENVYGVSSTGRDTNYSQDVCYSQKLYETRVIVKLGNSISSNLQIRLLSWYR